MHKSVRITILFPTPFLQMGVIFMFPFSLARTIDEVEHPWCLSSRGEFLAIWRSTFAILQSTKRSPKCEQRGAITMLYLVTLYIEILSFVEKSIDI